MSSLKSGPVRTTLILVPLIAVPLIAIFGLPSLEPLNASNSQKTDPKTLLSQDRIGVGESLRHTNDDIFAPIRPGDGSHDRPHGGPLETSIPTDLPPQPRWNQPPPAQKDRREGSEWAPPEDALNGQWEIDQQNYQAKGRNIEETQQKREIYNWPEKPQEQRQPPANPREQFYPEPNATPFPQESPRKGGPRPITPPPDQYADNTPDWAREQPASSPPEPPQSFGEFEEPEASPPPVAPAPRETPALPAREEELSWKTATQKLRKLGIRDYQLAPGVNPTEYHFSCTFTPPNNPKVTYRFEAEAGAPLLAVEKVIRQIEQWKARQ